MTAILIAVVGNVSSGKSTLCRALAEELRGFGVVSLDAERRRGKGEVWARLSVSRKLERARRVIFESTGAGSSFRDAIAGFPAFHIGRRSLVLVVRLELSREEAELRTDEKIAGGYIWPDLPSEWGFDAPGASRRENIRAFAERIEGLIPAGDVQLDARRAPEELARAVAGELEARL